MNDQHVARLEAHIERLVEGAFTHLFGKRLSPQEIALQLARAMEDGIEVSSHGDPRPIAPDHYLIAINPVAQSHLLQRQPRLALLLAEHLVELAVNLGYRLNYTPVVDIRGDSEIPVGKVSVKANHAHRKHSTTAVMQRVDLSSVPEMPRNPQLLLNGSPGIPLLTDVINVGRSHDNQVIVDDRSVSRHHLQLRLRYGRYTLFDTQSHGGTYVNDVPVKEHILQSGDVIRIGNTRLVYMEDHPLSDSQTGVGPSADPDSTNSVH